MAEADCIPLCSCGKPLRVFKTGRVSMSCCPEHHPKILAKNARQQAFERARLDSGCAYCGATFDPAARHQKYCSDKCRDAAATARVGAKNKAKLAVIPCERCSKEFLQINVRSRFCSRECMFRGRSSWRRAKTIGAAAEHVDPIAVFMRDGLKCQMCGKKTPLKLRGTTKHNAPELDHRVPLTKGGEHTYSNVQCACRACNSAKSNKANTGQLPMFEVT